MQESGNDLGTLMAEAEQLFQRLGSDGMESLGAVLTSLCDKISTVPQAFSGRGFHLQRALRRQVHYANRFVEDHLWQAIAGAAAIGFLPGSCLKRRD